ncbi:MULTISPECIES: ATP phosphoribosyltransferase regulatory subunit [Petrotoga]|jgi:ATP phosphoribosyltransferase regulatory subunit|uniref:ATP phosphoribosyltransferase regulatory subunit n=1 Tax=Petrotoga TaxID=28236 RepID=UPI000CA016ED|nr:MULTISPECIES: ATP phosphoribosyltransferase regulatory subunit [Petrotoga]MDK2907335.1 phosphoribosyltransferase regulatory subunit [Petrotoga sp.]
MKKDIFAESQKLSNIVNKIRSVLIKHDFYELFPPSITKYSENLIKGLKFADGRNFYLLKPDVTSWLIDMDKVEEKEKVFYISEVLDENLSGVWQFGFEILNGEEVKIEEEILRLTIEILSLLDIKNFFIDVSSIRSWERILKAVPQYRDKILRAVELRNFEIIENLPLDEEVKLSIANLFNYRGKETNIPKLNTIIKNINDPRIYIDLGTMKYMNYYEDVVFEIYSPDNGYLLGNGGQYKINGKYSCGMALNLDIIGEMMR